MLNIMFRRLFTSRLLQAALSLGMFAGFIANAATQRPNIILILADDLGHEVLETDDYSTPTLDAMAENGLWFTQTYVTPLCTPTRLSMMTGQYGHRNYDNFGSFPKSQVDQTFGTMMQKAGYRTCFAGKWQLGSYSPSDMGFDQHIKYITYEGVDINKNYFWNPTDASILSRVIENDKKLEKPIEYGPDYVLDFIEDFVTTDSEQPFFVYYPMLLTHGPFQPTPDTEDKDFSQERAYTNLVKYFPDNVSYMDKLIRQLLETVTEAGLAENTVILFVGDNGSPGIKAMVNGELRGGGKTKFTDAGTHVPFLAYWKGTTPVGQKVDDLVDASDFYATIAELAGVPEAAEGRDGVSFAAQLMGKEGPVREWAFSHYKGKPKGGRSKATGAYWVRDHRWKLYHDGRLIDVANDYWENSPIMPGEDIEQTSAIRERLEAAFVELEVTPESLEFK